MTDFQASLDQLFESESLRRFLAWQSTGADEEEIRRIADEVGVDWDVLERLRAAVKTDGRWRLLARAHGLNPELIAVAAPPAPRRTTMRRWWIGVAAALLLAVSGAHLLSRSDAPVATTEPTIRTIATARGQRMSIRLSDGTLVTLAPASTLTVPERFGGGPREVTLDGAAYFAVVHDARHPFRVRAGDLLAEDLGTEFVVDAYGDQARAEVVVREGIVAIRRAGELGAPARRIVPGQRGYLARAGEPVVERADTAIAFSWTVGELVFQNTPLAEAVAKLERWYDVEIHLGSPVLAERTLSGTFAAGHPASEALDVLATVLNLELVQAGARNFTLRLPTH